jgi:DNA-directed RNA polymerase specialized sigma subunit
VTKSVSPDLYEKYKQVILEMSPAIQEYRRTTMIRQNSCLSDLEIAERLGLSVEEVAEIRCIAEVDLVPLERWIDSDNWKQAKTGYASVKQKGED